MQRGHVFTELPIEVRVELDARIRSSNYSGYAELARWLRDSGYDVSKSAVHRYGQKLQEIDNRSGVVAASVLSLRTLPKDRRALRQELAMLQSRMNEVLNALLGVEK